MGEEVSKGHVTNSCGSSVIHKAELLKSLYLGLKPKLSLLYLPQSRFLSTRKKKCVHQDVGLGEGERSTPCRIWKRKSTYFFVLFEV